jgi:outer membrane receptor for ferrienterochelin and colicins
MIRRLATLAVLSAVPLAAAPIAVSAQAGSVVDRVSNGPLPGATVGWSATAEAAPTRWIDADLRGQFAVPVEWSGSGVIHVRALGHKLLQLSVADAAAASWRLALEPDPMELESLVVTASGRTQRRAEIPVPIISVSTEEIEASGAVAADDLLAEFPGLQTTAGTPVGSNIMIRGIGDSRVLVLLDGQPAGGALLENRDLSRMSLAGVERVEVVKGPLSSQYGSDALGGVINVITQEPETGLSADGRFMAGGTGRLDADGTISGGGAFRYRVTGSWRQEDQVPGLDSSADVFSRVWDVRTSARYDDGGPVRVRTDFSFVRERQRWPVGGGFSGFNDNRGITAWAEGRSDFGPGEVALKALWQDYDHLYRSARGDAPIAGDEELQQERLGEVALTYGAGLAGHAIDLGAEASRRSIESPDKLLEDEASDRQLEVFGQDSWRIGRTTLNGGVRGTFNDQWGNAASPTVGLTTLLGEGLLLRGSVGRGFRAPSFKELAWDFANIGAGYTVQGFRDLQPERSWSVGAGAEWVIAGMTLSADAYRNEIENLIEFAFVGSTSEGLLVFSPRNVHKARTQGVEATAATQLGPVRVDADYAYLNARSLEDDLPLDRRAPHTGRVRFSGEAQVLRGLRGDLSAHFRSDAPIIGTDGQGQPAEIDTQEALLALDAQVTLQGPANLRLIVGVDNLLDATPEGWPAVAGRVFRVGLEARDLF